ncbi:16S rRNA (guanine(527)-N(7))-methyltransferase RsmG [Robiginitalea sediminis]|uniref:16S rRNA (guanine(527)-N(7))-methyltransferase RsmG n=1 Tax=Robiginitalea sediminis TaxID=1982593 RepID=UPI000B4B1A23|nr:16S rRNA (guanine(527)-N(7))-methyltransferase RsmG [Robiginitalea sediminis]
MKAETVFRYFPDLSDLQRRQIEKLGALYQDWNQKINVVSRKDIEELYLRHVLHSLGIAKVLAFEPGTSVLDVGTGGGFPGIPLAILFPDAQFTLVDSRIKKISVVEEVIRGLGLENARALCMRVEEMDQAFDYIVSRAVAAMPTFVRWTHGRLTTGPGAPKSGGTYYLKGGDLSEELAGFPQAQVTDLSSFFGEPFFETKKVVYLPARAQQKKPR